MGLWSQQRFLAVSQCLFSGHSHTARDCISQLYWWPGEARNLGSGDGGWGEESYSLGAVPLKGKHIPPLPLPVVPPAVCKVVSQWDPEQIPAPELEAMSWRWQSNKIKGAWISHSYHADQEPWTAYTWTAVWKSDDILSFLFKHFHCLNQSPN